MLEPIGGKSMLRVLTGVLAIALMMGTTAAQADAAPRAGTVTQITVEGTGANGDGLCQFSVTVHYNTIRQSGWGLYAVLLVRPNDNYVTSMNPTIAKGTSETTTV